jgi:hypothetical protein
MSWAVFVPQLFTNWVRFSLMVEGTKGKVPNLLGPFETARLSSLSSDKGWYFQTGGPD